MPFGLYSSQTLLSYLDFQSFDFERNGWRLIVIQKSVVRTKFDIYAFITDDSGYVCIAVICFLPSFIVLWPLRGAIRQEPHVEQEPFTHSEHMSSPRYLKVNVLRIISFYMLFLSLSFLGHVLNLQYWFKMISISSWCLLFVLHVITTVCLHKKNLLLIAFTICRNIYINICLDLLQIENEIN